MLTAVIYFFKYLSILVGSISGVIGLFVEFRDKRTKKITKHGYIILALILSSGFISVAIQTFEMLKEQNENIEASKRVLEQAQKNNEILTSINRTLNPIKDVYINYTIEIPDSEIEIKNYMARLADDCSQISQDLNAKDHTQLFKKYGISAVRLSKQGAVTEIRITEFSSMFPSAVDEKVAYQSFFFSAIGLGFYKDSSISAYSEPKRTDLSIPRVMTHINEAALEGKHSLVYDITAKKLYLQAYRVNCDPIFWVKTGKILSTVDFPNSALVVSVLTVIGSGDSAVDNRVLRIKETLKFASLVFNMSDGLKFSIPGNRLVKLNRKDGLSDYLFRFPSTVEGISQLH